MDPMECQALFTVVAKKQRKKTALGGGFGDQPWVCVLMRHETLW